MGWSVDEGVREEIMEQVSFFTNRPCRQLARPQNAFLHFFKQKIHTFSCKRISKTKCRYFNLFYLILFSLSTYLCGFYIVVPKLLLFLVGEKIIIAMEFFYMCALFTTTICYDMYTICSVKHFMTLQRVLKINKRG